jgi:hypothetical protein
MQASQAAGGGAVTAGSATASLKANETEKANAKK